MVLTCRPGKYMFSESDESANACFMSLYSNIPQATNWLCENDGSCQFFVHTHKETPRGQPYMFHGCLSPRFEHDFLESAPPNSDPKPRKAAGRCCRVQQQHFSRDGVGEAKSTGRHQCIKKIIWQLELLRIVHEATKQDTSNFTGSGVCCRT